MAQLASGQRLIFVGGSARAGTTLVQNILDSHPQICGGPVFGHIPNIVELRNTLHRAIQLGWTDAFCSKHEVDQYVANLIEQLLLPLADRSGCRFLSEKTTANILVFEELAEILPAARFIRMVRDPRAVVSSLVAVGRRARAEGLATPTYTHNLSNAIAHVAERLQAGSQACDLLTQRVYTLIYERLVSNPQTETKKLCDFLRIEWSSAMLRPSQKVHPGAKVIVNSIWYASKESYYRDPHPGEIDKWKRNLSALQKARIAAAFRNDPQLADFGYGISYSRVDRLWNLLGRCTGTVDEIACSVRRGLLWVVKSLRARWPAIWPFIPPP